MMLVLVFAVAVDLILALGIPLYYQTPMGDAREKFFWGEIGAILGIASVYVGHSLNGRHDNERRAEKA